MSLEEQPKSARMPIVDREEEAPALPSSRRFTHGASLASSIDVRGADGEKRVPFSVAAMRGGDLLVFSFLAGGASILDRFDAKGAHLGVVARFAVGDARGELRLPAGVAAGADGKLYIADAERCRVLRMTSEGSLLGELGAAGTAFGELNGPRDVDADARGRIIVADSENHRVQVWDERGEVLACWGAEASEDDESKFLPSGSAFGEFFRPLGVTFDREGFAWVADTNNHRVQRLSIEGGFDRAFGEEGEELGQLKFPIDLRIDDEGSVVVADLGGKRIQWFTREGKIERAIDVVDALPDGAVIADVDVTDEGDVLVPVGPLAKVFRVSRGART